MSARVLVLVHVWVRSVGPEARFWGAFAFRSQLPENPGVCLWSYPGGSEVFLVSLLLFVASFFLSRLFLVFSQSFHMLGKRWSLKKAP